MIDYWIVKVLSTSTAGLIAAISEARISIEAESSENDEIILSASPNPFIEVVKLQFTLTKHESVILKAYND
ncbi:hypothetical protein Q0590_00050 [Rhodocytophaga aerolata]|uniref:Uncharacterized protein n=1 Tax=Rhodocytophaga aerolata TaxID=455078 RepID=A0ABT8QXP0_9BACT|nr:hypothetical protein [Rhodocytophaga aerolata]MDO1444615.1 hypothetical protein [Rhodocytophaga aerolata]